MVVWEILVGNYPRIQFQWLEYRWMTSCSTKMLVESELIQEEDWSEVRTE